MPFYGSVGPIPLRVPGELLHTVAPPPPPPTIEGWYRLDEMRAYWFDGKTWAHDWETARVPRRSDPRMTPEEARRAASFGRSFEVRTTVPARVSLANHRTSYFDDLPEVPVQQVTLLPGRGKGVYAATLSGGGDLPRSEAAWLLPLLADGPLEVSGTVLLDGEHPQLLVHLPDPDLLLPANDLPAEGVVMPGGPNPIAVPLCRTAEDFAVAAAATSSWWSGARQSVWVLASWAPGWPWRFLFDLDGNRLPSLLQPRPGSAALARSWDRLMWIDESPWRVMEAVVVQTPKGRQVTVMVPRGSAGR